jgi:hypothetical protein
MIRTAKLLFCDQEHGVGGEMTFPDVHAVAHTLHQHFIVSLNAKELRKQAKKEGWSFVDGHDYCPVCTEGEKEGAQ